MSLRFAIITSLLEREATGLELTRRFDRSFGYFWPASHQQIYRELRSLLDAGLIEEKGDPARPGRGQPRVVGVTEEGVASLRRWIGELDEPRPERSSLAVRIRAAAATGELGGVEDAVRRHLAAHTATLETYREIERRDFADRLLDAEGELHHLVLRSGLANEQAWIGWCEDALELLQRLRRSE
ncbi:DNA-binding transcriptional regulator, PadR family [Lentzea fradiae]|uniref:DNA-binding transcriptional regulator, PadR family n=1 Tax=Lentzea fradiae TaxID=200378 RepID=A0A1G7KZ04_9PSEU|nr:PadR family transcriptional regulator [Lentzea fradiae]SDF42478.1 DNA-binding transcriptional regulator, PadR family [Lentzea fradiae]